MTRCALISLVTGQEMGFQKTSKNAGWDSMVAIWITAKAGALNRCSGGLVLLGKPSFVWPLQTICQQLKMQAGIKSPRLGVLLACAMMLHRALMPRQIPAVAMQRRVQCTFKEGLRNAAVKGNNALLASSTLHATALNLAILAPPLLPLPTTAPV
jgi:hypothetical protein